MDVEEQARVNNSDPTASSRFRQSSLQWYSRGCFNTCFSSSRVVCCKLGQGKLGPCTGFPRYSEPIGGRRHVRYGRLVRYRKKQNWAPAGIGGSCGVHCRQDFCYGRVGCSGGRLYQNSVGVQRVEKQQVITCVSGVSVNFVQRAKSRLRIKWRGRKHTNWPCGQQTAPPLLAVHPPHRDRPGKQR